jgi:very-short-patch-repair endonuclease
MDLTLFLLYTLNPMRNGQLNNLKLLTPIRKELRNGATVAEAMLWKQLKSSQLAGRKFRRQHSIGLFVLDFYCPSERLAVELDGEVHNTLNAKIHDEERQKAIETLDIHIIRFQNIDILQDIDQVLDTIQHHFRQ